MSLNISEFINNLIIYDYILFSTLFVLFILFIILGIILRDKTVLAIILILLAFSELIVGSTYGYGKMHEYLFKNETLIKSQKKLTFTQAVVVYGSVKNISKRDFQQCKVTARIFKKSKNKYKDYILKLKPIKKMSIIQSDIPKDQEREVKLIIEPFTYKGDYNITMEADCR